MSWFRGQDELVRLRAEIECIKKRLVSLEVDMLNNVDKGVDHAYLNTQTAVNNLDKKYEARFKEFFEEEKK